MTERVLCAQALHPAQHAELKARLQEGQARRRIERALDALSAALSARGLAADLSGRPKNLWGVFGKMAAKGYGLESVYDARAMRVIVSSKADCYEALRQVPPALCSGLSRGFHVAPMSCACGRAQAVWAETSACVCAYGSASWKTFVDYAKEPGKVRAAMHSLDLQLRCHRCTRCGRRWRGD